MIPSLNKCFLFAFTAVLLILCRGQYAGILNGTWPEAPDGLMEWEGQQTVELPEATLLVLTENKKAPYSHNMVAHSLSQGRNLGEYSDY